MFRNLSIMCFLVFMISSYSYAYIITGYGPDEYLGSSEAELEQMEINLGICGMIIEDFEDDILEPNLSIVGDGVTDPAIVDQGDNGWGRDGTGFFRVLTLGENDVTIIIEGGTPFLGFGLSAFESSIGNSLTSFSINGGSPIYFNSQNFPEFIFTHTYRNGYLAIQAEEEDALISTVKFRTIGDDDGYQFDYIAFMAEPLTLIILSPNGGEYILAETKYDITWENSDNSSIDRVKLEYSTDNSQTWSIIDPNTENDEHYEWDVPIEESNECLVRISEVDNPSINDISDDVFTIYQCTEDEPADFDDNCVVDILDFAYFASRWLWCGNPFDVTCQ